MIDLGFSSISIFRLCFCECTSWLVLSFGWISSSGLYLFWFLVPRQPISTDIIKKTNSKAKNEQNKACKIIDCDF